MAHCWSFLTPHPRHEKARHTQTLPFSVPRELIYSVALSSPFLRSRLQRAGGGGGAVASPPAVGHTRPPANCCPMSDAKAVSLYGHCGSLSAPEAEARQTLLLCSRKSCSLTLQPSEEVRAGREASGRQLPPLAGNGAAPMTCDPAARGPR